MPAEVAPKCELHGTEMIKVRDNWYCKDCLYSSHLTYQAQRQATKNWRQSEKGRVSEKEYEQSEKGKAARNKYLKSDKYKEARKRYNERLKESLALARQARAKGSGATKPSEVEVDRNVTLDGLVSEIRQYADAQLRPPTVENVIRTAKVDYNQTIDKAKAQELIERALKSRRG